MKTYSADSRQRATLYIKAQLSEMREIQCIISRTIINQVYNCPINKYFAFAIRNTSRNPEKNHKNKEIQTDLTKESKIPTCLCLYTQYTQDNPAHLASKAGQETANNKTAYAVS
jgi:hypothetical protein